MKKIFTSLFVAAITSSLLAQFEWVGDFGFSSSANGLFKTKNNQYILVRDATDNAGFTALDSNGKMLFNFSDSFPFNGSVVDQGELSVQEIIELADSSIIIFTESVICDDPWGSNSYFSIKKYDNNWNELDIADDLLFVKEVVATPVSDGFVIANATGIERRDSDGNITWEIPPFAYFFYDAATLAGDTLVIATFQGTFIVDQDGEIDSLYQDLILDKIITTPQNNLLGQKGDSLFLFSPQFDLINSVGFGGETIADFYADTMGVAVVTRSSHVYLFNAFLALQNEIQVPIKGFANSIATEPDGFVLSITGFYGNDLGASLTPYLKKYNYDGTAPDFSKDIGVIGIGEDASSNEFTLPNGDYKLQYDELKVTIHNFGDKLVDSLKLNARFETLWIGPTCEKYYQFLHKKFTSISLMPGESVDLYWDNFDILFNSKPTAPFDICIWTSLPDQRLDSNNDNDRFCSSFLVNDEEPTMDIDFSIYPNPSSSGSTIDYDLPVLHEGHVRVFNSMGILMGSYETGSGTGAMSLPKFPNGFYFIVLEMDGQVAKTLKFVQL